MVLACGPGSVAQDTAKTGTKKKAVLLSEQEWKAVEGVFQSPQNNEMNVQFKANNDQLVAKLLWNNGELHLIAESPLVFSSVPEGDKEIIRISFIKDSSGAVNQVSVFNNGVWKRNNNYKPPSEKKEMVHTPDQLKPFEGIYQLANEGSRIIDFTVKNNTLALKQEWNGVELSFVPETSMDFFRKDDPFFTLSFSKDQDGRISEVLAFKRDLWKKKKIISYTNEQLRIFEGIFKSTDDPDNHILLIAQNRHLVVRQLWDKKETIVETRAENYFYNEGQSYSVIFFNDSSGKPNQAMLYGMNMFERVR
jgi:hypothetical protein